MSFKLINARFQNVLSDKFLIRRMLYLICVLFYIHKHAAETNTNLYQEIELLKLRISDLESTVHRQDQFNKQLIEKTRQQDQLIASLTQDMHTGTKQKG